MLVISGANGQTGSVVADTLLQKGLPVRVIVRNEASGKAWQEKRAEMPPILWRTGNPCSAQ